MARVVVTGGAGYVGSHCVKLLAANGHECVVVDDLSTGSRDFLRWGTFVMADIRDAAGLSSAFQKPVDAVMHFAGLSAVGESVAAPGRYYDVNVHGTRVLLDAMVGAQVQAIIFSSSCAIYGEPTELPIREQSPVNPVNPYGHTKLVCEEMIRAFGKAYGIRSACLRYFNAAGADRAGELGEDHARETRLIPLALDAVTGRRPPLCLFGTDYDTEDGTAIRDYIHVEDLARAHLSALEHLLRGGQSLAVNLGTGHGASVKEVLDSIVRVTGREVPFQVADRRPGDPSVLVSEALAAADVLGWKAERSDLDTIVEDAWRWHLRRFG